MRAVYAHFPINTIIQPDGRKLEIVNFLGEKVRLTKSLWGLKVNTRQAIRNVDMLEGVTIAESKAQKDELILEGNDIENVSQSGISLTKADETATHRFSQPHRSKVAAKYGTRISVNSWMVSMSQSGRRWLQTKRC